MSAPYYEKGGESIFLSYKKKGISAPQIASQDHLVRHDDSIFKI